MALQINELLIRAEIVKTDGKKEQQTDVWSDYKVRQILRHKALNEDKKKRER